ncbi:nucleosomal histone kinase 1-like [Macrosteles quadrilineatus]|uniref:nucleosomal histone kinase 1-like n=1 Tax=Macrosteles quadrilineatus TaxID=74068 RepID=UPI0023E2F6A4|nr:nucleosomal histone kinase 1-like [Macrosteles quadrilineatus]
MASKAKKPRKANGYKMPPPIPTGFSVKNSREKNKSWKLGTSIGKGGFGEIYCCSAVEEGSTSISKVNQTYVMKIEPQENGPLFVEMHFYMKAAKKEDIEGWMKSKGLKRLGMPCYVDSGTFEYNKERFRYIVMDRYGQDLWSIFLENKKLFPCSTVLQIGLQVIDVLEYMHDKGYAHCDVKGANLLLDTQDQVYLVDFGLASRLSTDFKPDPKRAHDGTIEYTSRDAHTGVRTRRGDLEVLGYNLLHWTTSALPWENITDPKVVEEKKKSILSSGASSVKKTLPSTPLVIVNFLDYVSKLKPEQIPDYNHCRKLFKDELKKLGASVSGKFVFSTAEKKTPKKAAAKPTKVTRRGRKENVEVNGNSASQDEEEDEELVEGTPEEPKKRSRAVKAKTAPKASWKDSATAKASNVVKAGEYVSINPKPTRKRRNE